MNITSVKYAKDALTEENMSFLAVINGQECGVPFDPDNTDYAEIMRLVDAGELTIAAAE